jgi:precorrin-6Y C5,15-methyltransferase (decarboxylating)
MTQEALEAIESSDALIGARRLIDPYRGAKDVYEAISPQEVRAALEKCAPKKAAILVSGDPGYYSLAKGLRESLEGYSLKCIAGLSSLSYLASRIGVSWEGAVSVSAHGRDCDVVPAASKNPSCFVLSGGSNTPQSIFAALERAGLGYCPAWVGERLSYEGEKITEGTASSLAGGSFDSLSALFLQNPRALGRYIDIPDEDFIRGKAPMTKAEARAAAISKMALRPGDCVYDVGAGTGSVSIEAAMRAGRVYAIEREAEALSLLRQNIARHAAFNVAIVEGSAPAALIGLPVPDKAFVGGSGGNMGPIVAALALANPEVRVVANTVSLEGLAEAKEALSQLPGLSITMVQASRAKKAGNSHLMIGENPIYILAAGGKR